MFFCALHVCLLAVRSPEKWHLEINIINTITLFLYLVCKKVVTFFSFTFPVNEDVWTYKKQICVPKIQVA